MVLELDSLTMENVADLKERLNGDYGQVESIKVDKFIDSSGLGVLIEITKYKIKHQNTKLVLKDLKYIQKAVIGISKLNELFDIQ